MDARAAATLAVEAAVNFAISGALNALCAWLLFHESGWAPTDFWSLFVDTTITCFCVSVITALFATASARRYRARGLDLSVRGAAARALAALPEAAFPLGACLFGMCLPALVAAFGIAFSLAGVTALPCGSFMLFKGIWGGAFGALACVAVLRRPRNVTGK